MLRLTRHETASAFLVCAQAWLEENEAANNLTLGIAMRLAEHPDRVKRPPYLATLDREGAPVAAAVMTPPHRVVLCSALDADPVALQPVVDDLREGGWHVPGVLAPSTTSEAFAALWEGATGSSIRPGMRQRVLELREVVPPRPVAGILRPATESDLSLAAAWVHNFMRDAGLPGTAEEAQAIAALRIDERDLFLWDDDGPASMAAKTRHMAHGVAVSLVYTPRELRGRGYASACVAALSQRLLDAGWEFCALFTDLANPTSNDIYQRIGYRPVCDFLEYHFEER